MRWNNHLNKRFLHCLWLFFLWLTLCSCGREPLYQTQGYVFGTLVDVSIYGETEARAHELSHHILQDFQGINDRLHAWHAGSDLDRLNQAFTQSQKPVAISAELARMITQAQIFSERSQGLFNPAIGGLIQLWGFQRDEFTPVNIDTVAIEKLVKAKPAVTDIVIQDNTAYSKNPAVKLDFGGYAKGYALDRAAAYLRDQGAQNALINIGGNIIALGKHGKKPWRIGIQHPRKPGQLRRWIWPMAGRLVLPEIINVFLC